MFYSFDAFGCWITFSWSLNREFPLFNRGREAFDWCINLPFLTIMKV